MPHQQASLLASNKRGKFLGTVDLTDGAQTSASTGIQAGMPSTGSKTRKVCKVESIQARRVRRNYMRWLEEEIEALVWLDANKKKWRFGRYTTGQENHLYSEAKRLKCFTILMGNWWEIDDDDQLYLYEVAETDVE
jgi:hypothetical protein